MALQAHLDHHHARLERLAESKLTEAGYSVLSSMTYHDTLPADEQMQLVKDYSPTALAIRTQADRLVLAPDGSSSFLLELKTNSSPSHRQAGIELLPLVRHIQDSLLGVRCLYVYRDEIDKEIGIRCWWADVTPAPVKVVIPERWTGRQRRYFRDLAITTWPDSPIWEDAPVNGSGDPFVIISRDDLLRMAKPSEILPRFVA